MRSKNDYITKKLSQKIYFNDIFKISVTKYLNIIADKNQATIYAHLSLIMDFLDIYISCLIIINKQSYDEKLYKLYNGRKVKKQH